jgi:hypothetical protein
LINFLISIFHYKPIQLLTRLKLIFFGRRSIDFKSEVDFNKVQTKKFLATALHSKKKDSALNTIKALEENTIIYLNQFHASSDNFFENKVFSKNDSLKKYELSYLNCFSDLIFCENTEFFKSQIIKINRIYSDSQKIKFKHPFWYPYAVSSRLINISILVSHFKSSNLVSKESLKICNNLFYDYSYLKKNIEFDSDGNHLLKNYVALCIASIFFEECETSYFYKMLIKNLNVQILESGFHYEKSFDYHNSLLYDLSLLNALLEENKFNNKELTQLLEKMISFSIKLNRKNKILFNDSFKNYHFNFNAMIDYLSLKYKEFDSSSLYPFKSFGIDNFELLAYLSDISPSHCPAHLHDSIGTYELWFNNEKFITDSGNYDYNDSQTRLYFRSTKAHNLSTASENGQSIIYKPFRFGRKVKLNNITNFDNGLKLSYSEVNGIFSQNQLSRTFEIIDEYIQIHDITSKDNSYSFIHINPNINIDRVSNSKYILSKDDNFIIIQIDSSSLLDSYISKTPFSDEFYCLKEKNTINIKFNNQLRYSYIRSTQ